MTGALRSICVRLALALALVAAAAPRPADAAPTDPALAAFLAMGGRLSDLCGDPAMPGPHADHRHCDGCRVLAALVPDPPRCRRAAPAELIAEATGVAQAPPATAHGIPPRGPPPAG